jgi:type II secretory pathway pseudopilin PulG
MNKNLNPCYLPRRGHSAGLTLIEMVVVMLIMSLMVGMVIIDVVSAFRRGRLDEDVARFSETLTLAAEQAIFNRKNYLVVIEVMDGYYTVYEELGDGQYDELDPLLETEVLNWCYIETIEYEDGSRQYSGEVTLRATPTGWENSVLFSFLDDENDRQRFLRCDQMTARNVVSNRPLDFFWPEEQVSMVNPL